MAVLGWVSALDVGPSIEEQRSELERAGCDLVLSAQDHQFEDLLTNLQWGDVVAVSRLECFGGSLQEVLSRVERIHEECAYIRSVQQSLDTGQNDANSKTLIRLMGVFAEVDRNLGGLPEASATAAQTSASIPSKSRSKGRGGRKPVIAAEIKQAIIDAVNAGESQYSQAKKYKISRTSVLRIMRGDQ